jgi:hypothetical protein
MRVDDHLLVFIGAWPSPFSWLFCVDELPPTSIDCRLIYKSNRVYQLANLGLDKMHINRGRKCTNVRHLYSGRKRPTEYSTCAGAPMTSGRDEVFNANCGMSQMSTVNGRALPSEAGVSRTNGASHSQYSDEDEGKTASVCGRCELERKRKTKTYLFASRPSYRRHVA